MTIIEGLPIVAQNFVALVDKHRYDLYYIRHRSWYLDLKILFRTVRVAFTGEGI